MKIVALSDTHNQHKKIVIPDGDILVHCGDFSNTGAMHEIQSFANWFGKQSHKIKILVPGNHEVSMDPLFYDTNWKKFHKKKVEIPTDYWTSRGIIVLNNETITIEGIKIWGCPALPSNQDNWAFHFTSFQESDNTFKEINDIDIMITHSPPYGILDIVSSGINIGNEEMVVHVTDRIRPKLCLFGHVHRPGNFINEHGTHFYNVAMCNDTLFGPKLVYKPFELNI